MNGLTIPIRDDDSVLAPLVLGFHETDEYTDLVDLVMQSAALGVPTISAPRSIVPAGQRKAISCNHARKVILGKDRTGNQLARLCDVRKEDSDAWGHFRWEVSVKAFDNSGSSFAVDAPTLIRIAVTGFIVSEGVIDSSYCLFLFRHLLVKGFAAIDSKLVMIGGQRDWTHDYWMCPQVASAG
jgi:hypothetical protein